MTKDKTNAQASRQPSYLPNVAKGAMINLFGAGSRTVLLYAYTLLLARTLAPSELGEYFLAFTIINILGLVATVGLDFGVVRYVSLFAGEGKFVLVRKTLTAGLLLGIPVAVAVTTVLIGLAPQLAGILLDNSQTSVAALRIFAISIPFWVAARLFNATTQGMHRMQYQVYSRDMGEQFSKFCFSILALALGSGLVGVMWANVASVAVAAGMSLWYATLVLPRVGQSEGTQPNPSGRIFRYSFPLAFSNILGMILIWVDMLLMGYLGTSTDVGYYGAALRVGTGSAAVLLAFATVFTPVISDLYNKHHAVELQALYKTVARWIFTCSFPIFIVIVMLANPVMRLFGSDFTAGSGTLVLLAFSQLINAGTGTAGLMVLMSGRSQMELLNVAVSLVVNVALCILLIPSLGMIGAAIANVSAAGVINLMRAAEVWIFLRMHAYDRDYIKPILAGAGGALMVFLEGRFVNLGSSLVALLVPAATLVAVYIILTVALGLDEHDKMVVGMFKGRLTRTEAM